MVKSHEACGTRTHAISHCGYAIELAQTFEVGTKSSLNTAP